uniref:Uncharacterized protein n=1 Tax=Anguilla anguilla TaxID=7936 RepID=A0A0E9T811_ANGAN
MLQNFPDPGAPVLPGKKLTKMLTIKPSLA